MTELTLSTNEQRIHTLECRINELEEEVYKLRSQVTHKLKGLAEQIKKND